MRSLLVAAVLLAAVPAHAEQLPEGAIGLLTGIVAGTGADNKRIGTGWYYLGAQAAWQPMTTERGYGLTIRWSTMFGYMYGGSASHIDTTLRTVQMDLTAGVRVRPWQSVKRYLTFRAGAELLRSNEPIPNDASPTGQRSYYGGIASVGLDQYLSSLMLSFDLRYGLVGGGGPQELSFMVGIAIAGP
ncbi:MAG: hypothetical protein ABJE66_27870 [Deltaproteobacteria bacterium]